MTDSWRLRLVAVGMMALAWAVPALADPLDAKLAAEHVRPVPAQIPRDAFLVEPTISSATIAPDGGHVAWLRRIGEETSLWLRPTGGTPRKLLRRADADDIFWSHDGRWLFLASNRTLRMIAVSGDLGSGLVAQLGRSTGLSFAGIDPWRPAAAILKEELRVDGRRDPVSYRLWRVERGGKRTLIAFGRRNMVDYAIGPDGRLAFGIKASFPSSNSACSNCISKAASMGSGHACSDRAPHQLGHQTRSRPGRGGPRRCRGSRRSGPALLAAQEGDKGRRRGGEATKAVPEMSGEPSPFPLPPHRCV